MAYTAIRLGADGPVLAVGRDLRSVAAIQQRFLSHQQELERSYWRAREAETRERRLHQVATDAMFLVDAPTLAIERVGPLPSEWSGAFNEPMSGRLLAELFDAHSRGPLDELLATARGMGRPLEIRVRLRATHQSVSVAATPLRVGDAQRLLVRVRGIAETAVSPTELVVIGDSTGRLASCTPRVVELAAASDEAGLRGRSVADAIGAAPQAFATLLADVRHDGIAAASMALRRHDGLRWPARVAATLLTEGDQECIGFVITPEHAARPDEPPSSTAAVAAGLADRLGSAPLRQLMSEAAAQVERELIASALQRSGGDERAAAGLLGVSLTGLRRRQRKGKTTREATRDGHQPAQRGERHEQ